jgi:hypothetical protein
MKVAHQRTETASAEDASSAIELVTGLNWAFDTPGISAPTATRKSLGAITDGELSRAAYTQAVALYDSCVQRVPLNVPRRQSKPAPGERS